MLVASVDSSLKSQITTDSQERFFTSQREEAIHFSPQPIIHVQEEWQIITLLLSMLTIAFVRITGKNFFKNLQSGFISKPIFKQLFRDGLLIPTQARIPLLVSFILVMTVFLFQLDAVFHFINFKPATNLNTRIFIIFLLIGSYEIVRFILFQFIGYIFLTPSTTKEFIANNIFYNSISTLLILPLLLFSIYSSNSIILIFAIFIFLSLFGIRTFRGLLIASELRTYSYYQIFLYICTLEILPVFVLTKLLTGYISTI